VSAGIEPTVVQNSKRATQQIAMQERFSLARAEIWCERPLLLRVIRCLPRLPTVRRAPRAGV
jgi:hypothetical protein